MMSNETESSSFVNAKHLKRTEKNQKYHQKFQSEKPSFNCPEKKMVDSPIEDPFENKGDSVSTMASDASMFAEQTDFIADYSDEILDHLRLLEQKLKTDDCLKNHSISHDLRARMIDWMIEVFTKCDYHDQTLFIASKLMDRFFKNCDVSCEANDLHIIGVCAMLIASKYEEIIPLRLDFVYEKILHKKYATDTLKKVEIKLLQTLKYYIGAPTQYEFLEHYLETLVNKSSVNFQFLKATSIYLAKVSLHDYDFCNVNPSLSAAAAIHVALKITDEVQMNHSQESLLASLSKLTKYSEAEIGACAQNILRNAQNFDKLFPGLEKLNTYNIERLNKIISTQ